MNNKSIKPKGSILVTGGAGFIGAHVSECLIQMNYKVTVLDDLSGGFVENVPKTAKFIKGSILDVKLLETIFKKYKFDHVFHLAAYAAEGLSHFIKRFNYNNNVIGSVNIINECVKNNVKCLVFTSSIAVYGTNQVPMREDLIPNPEDSYGIAKFTVEKELEASRRMFGLNHIIFRPHNVYGEKQNIGDRYRNVIGIFMNNIMKNRPLPIFGDGMQTRAFSYIRDIAPIMAKSIEIKKCYNEIFNIGADKNYSVNQLAVMVGKTMGAKFKIKYLKARKEVLHAYSDHKKIKKYFKTEPLTPIQQGIAQMAEWAKSVGIRESKKFKNIELIKNLPPSWKA